MTDTKTQTRVRTKLEAKEPSLYNVIYVNDDVTSMDFVITSLEAVFDHDRERAQQLTLDIHDNGSAVVATLPYEIAEQKGVEVTLLARNNGYPLQIKLEPEV
jgi:ATP-dependent Clp protease adaptor protein ClpS